MLNSKIKILGMGFSVSVILSGACVGGGDTSESTNEITRDQIAITGQVSKTEIGEIVDGIVTLGDADFGFSLEGEAIGISYDADGSLTGLEGDVKLPEKLSETISVTDSGARALARLMTAAEINADPDLGIQLEEGSSYLAFYVGGNVDLAVTDPLDPSRVDKLKLTTPAAGDMVFITNPLTGFSYRFASSPLLAEFGQGRSRDRAYKFKPSLDFSQLDEFSGSTIKKGAMGLGFKLVDFFNVDGVMVVKDPKFPKLGIAGRLRDCIRFTHSAPSIDWTMPDSIPVEFQDCEDVLKQPIASDIDLIDALNADVEYKAGVNGDLDFALSVVGVGLFSFDMAQTSGTIDVGLDRQHAAFDLRIQPDTGWVPEWFHVVPETEATGRLSINPATGVGLRLTGAYKSELPIADLKGTMEIENQKATFTGSTVHQGDSLDVSITFSDNQTIGRVTFPEKFSSDIKSNLTGEIDRQFDRIEENLAALETAKTEYQFEASLRGLRQTLPGIAGGAVDVLDSVPDTVEEEARAQARSYIDNTCMGKDILRTCLESILRDSTERSIINSIGRNAREEAVEAIENPRKAMIELKTQAKRGDDVAFRGALKSALSTALDYKTINKKVVIDYDFPKPFGRRPIYTTTIKRNVLSNEDIAMINNAITAVDLIPEKSEVMVSAQQIVDAMPTQKILESVRADVEAGAVQVPDIGGVGYISEEGVYRPFVMIDGQQIELGVNVMDPASLKDGVVSAVLKVMTQSE